MAGTQILTCSHSQSSPEPQSPVTKMVVAISDYTAQYSDELTFREGDRIEVKVESECTTEKDRLIMERGLKGVVFCPRLLVNKICYTKLILAALME